MSKKRTPPDVAAALAFINILFGDGRTESNVYFSSLRNNNAPENEPGERRYAGRDAEKLGNFISTWDKEHRGLFFAVGTVADRRAKDEIVETIGLHADIDYKGVQYNSTEEIDNALARLKCKPTVLVKSGHGLHLYWLLHKSIPAQANRDRVEKLLKLVCDHVAGDIQVCEISRLMRLPGTHNSKFDSWVPVTVVYDDGPRYELADLEDWLGDWSSPKQKPILQRCVGSLPGGSAFVPQGHGSPDAPPIPDNPFTRMAQEQGLAPVIDVEARLAAMVVGGVDGNGVNVTERDVTASLISRGSKVDDVVELVITAVRKLPGTEKWNWTTETRKVHNLCLTWLNKHPEIHEKQEQLQAQGQSQETVAGATVHNLDEARRAKQQAEAPPLKKLKRSDAPYVIADGVIDIMRSEGADIMHTQGDTWIYSAGFWRLMTTADEQLLRSLIQTGFDQLQLKAKPGDLNATWLRLMQHPLLTRHDIEWAGAGVIVCKNGVLNLVTGEFTEHSPLNYARTSIGADFVPGAECPIFQALLVDMFSDQDDAPQLVNLVKEWMGSALSINSLAREQRRALILIGPSRTGKTQLASVVSSLVGEPIAGPSVAEVSEDRFALASIHGANAWIRDDAVNEGDKLDPQRFKTIVTGEAVNIRQMYKTTIVRMRFDIPVLLTCNTKPAARDFSDAVANRALIVSMTKIYSETQAINARKLITGKVGGDLSADIFEREASGILNFALIGFAQLRSRGFFEIPPSVAGALQLFKDENNPVGEWSREGAIEATGIMVARRDVMRAYHGWEREREGDNAKLPGMRWILPKLRALFPGLKEYQNHAGVRFLVGIKLTKIGLNNWDAHGKDDPKSGHAKTVDQVNQVVGQDDTEEARFEE